MTGTWEFLLITLSDPCWNECSCQEQQGNGGGEGGLLDSWVDNLWLQQCTGGLSYDRKTQFFCSCFSSSFSFTFGLWVKNVKGKGKRNMIQAAKELPCSRMTRLHILNSTLEGETTTQWIPIGSTGAVKLSTRPDTWELRVHVCQDKGFWLFIQKVKDHFQYSILSCGGSCTCRGNRQQFTLMAIRRLKMTSFQCTCHVYYSACTPDISYCKLTFLGQHSPQQKLKCFLVYVPFVLHPHGNNRHDTSLLN